MAGEVAELDMEGIANNCIMDQETATANVPACPTALVESADNMTRPRAALAVMDVKSIVGASFGEVCFLFYFDSSYLYNLFIFYLFHLPMIYTVLYFPVFHF